jgi:riboflavin kinase / FMN adenylyltransferase
MEIITDLSALNLFDSVVSIGMFDGVHRGHRRVLKQLRDHGTVLKLPTVLVTFDPHPRAVLRPESSPALLSTLEDRMGLLALTGCIDYCLVLPFNRKRSSESADDFVAQTLCGGLGMRALVVGENFACGSGRKGNVQYLKALGSKRGFEVLPMSLRSDVHVEDGVHCSSSETRRLIQIGDFTSATAMLDRPYELTGTVVMPGGTGHRVIDVDLPGELCAPPTGNYAGAARKKDGNASWISAILQVRDERTPRARTVRLFADGDTGVTSGDAMTVRFLDSMRHFGRNCASSTAL